ncbi:uncharacterized protein L203_102448 [Cryptococcus depauperatus CBS 7841]|uniref:Uncharacterized protein n=1 Tax=Cryptococcus depauperatus CBS 7841 TaxID=1295531 RepID=A0A1E3HH27_9TREE|nr:hypothetical protein L203_06521 [Cryptococcus depauperatus CBS 7841]
MSAVVSPSATVFAPPDNSQRHTPTYAHRKINTVTTTHYTLGHVDNVLTTNGSDICVDSKDRRGVGMAFDLNAHRDSTNMMMSNEFGSHVNGNIPMDPVIEDGRVDGFGDVVGDGDQSTHFVLGKRKVEEELDTEGEDELLEDGDLRRIEAGRPAAIDATDSHETKDVTERLEYVEEKEDKAESDSRSDIAAFKEDEKPKRAPRKRRKWLRKGEVDPDDPVAVARQQAKHKLIDDAIGSLDAQEEALLKGTHPQLLSLWQELESRKQLQFGWVEARKEATESEYTRMKHHWEETARFNFHVRLDEIANELTHDNRQKNARIHAERTALRRDPNTLPNLRAGRGGGGWTIFDKYLLSTGEQHLISVEIQGQVRQRRDISREIRPLSEADAMTDLQKMGLIQPPAQDQVQSPSPPHRSSSIHSHYNHAHGQQSKRPPIQAPWPQPERRYQPPPVLPPTQPHGIWDRPDPVYHSLLPPPYPLTYDSRAVHEYDDRRERERIPPAAVAYQSRPDPPSRYHFWQDPVPGSSSSSKTGPPSMGYFPLYPRSTTLQSQMGHPPPRLSR